MIHGFRYRKSNDWNNAIRSFSSISWFPAAKTALLETCYYQGLFLRDNREWDAAIDAFKNANGYPNSTEQITATYLAEGDYKYAVKDWDGAVEAYSKAEANDLIHNVLLDEGNYKRSINDWSGAIEAFAKAGSEDDIKETTYMHAMDCIDSFKYDEAYRLLSSLGDYKDSANMILSNPSLVNARKNALTTIGNIISFGTFENKPVSWIVYYANDVQMWLLCDRALLAMSYDEFQRNQTNVFNKISLSSLEKAAVRKNFHLLSFDDVKTIPVEYRKCNMAWWLTSPAPGYNTQGIVGSEGGLYMRLANGTISALEAGAYRDARDGIRPAVVLSIADAMKLY